MSHDLGSRPSVLWARSSSGRLADGQGRASVSSALRGAVSSQAAVLVCLLAASLLARVLTDDLSPSDSRHSGSVNSSGAIALLFILVAAALLVRRRGGAGPAMLAALWLCIWTAVAVSARGASAETLREGVREGSVVALAVIAWSAREALSVTRAARLVQLVCAIPGAVALYQFAAGTGMNITGELRANGTLAHPNSAAMLFALAAAVSLWLCLERGRRAFDAVATVLFGAALIATFSIDGLITLAAMLLALGALRPGGARAKAVPFAMVALLLLCFFATPLGSRRIAAESATSVTERGEANSSLSWRLKKWKALLPEWRSAPVLGHGLGTTVTGRATPASPYGGEPPHNEYLRYLVETGLVGLATLLAALGALALRLLGARRALAGRDGPAFAAVTLGIVVLLGCLVNSLADNTLLDSPTCYLAALVLAAALGATTARGEHPAVARET
jgi:O-antigen ligase